MGKNDEYDPLKELANLIKSNGSSRDYSGDLFGFMSEPYQQEEIIPGIVGIYCPDTGRLRTIIELTEKEKDTLRKIAGEITHYRIFKR